MVERIEYNNLIMYINENGEFHRDDGPAIIYTDGTEIWYKNGEVHREDGPAVIYSNETVYWCLNNEIYSFDDWIEKVNISGEEKMELVLKYG